MTFLDLGTGTALVQECEKRPAPCEICAAESLCFMLFSQAPTGTCPKCGAVRQVLVGAPSSSGEP